MDKFTRLNLNGEVKWVSAIYDGSGNEIDTTYETIENASAKKSDLLARIDSANNLLSALTTRVEATETFATSIGKNQEDIQTNLNSINALVAKDSELQESLNTLTIGLQGITTDVTTLEENVKTINDSLATINSKRGSLEAITGDGASGINALNNQADENTANIAALEARIAALETKLAGQSLEA